MPNPAHWLNINIPEWGNLTSVEKRAIRDFPVLWSFFELHSTSQYGQPNASPQQIIRAVDDLHNDPAIERYETVREYFSRRYVQDDVYTHHWYALHLDNRYADLVRTGLVGEDRTGKDTLKALLLVVNRLRNNFLHGEKARYNFAGQYDNFTQANKLLMYALELWPALRDG